MYAVIFREFPIGWLRIAALDGAITEVMRVDSPSPDITESESEHALCLACAAQLGEYFIGERRVFDLPLKPHATEFARRVYDALLAIPYGQTASYGEIARAIGSPKAARAVGGANNRNPIVIIIPCHRVIGADGSPVGYGCGLEMKQRLLELEKKFAKNSGRAQSNRTVFLPRQS